jgi:hypothetical protein
LTFVSRLTKVWSQLGRPVDCRLAACGALDPQLDLAGLDQRLEDVLALLALEELGATGDLVARDPSAASTLDQPQDLLVV